MGTHIRSKKLISEPRMKALDTLLMPYCTSYRVRDADRLYSEAGFLADPSARLLYAVLRLALKEHAKDFIDGTTLPLYCDMLELDPGYVRSVYRAVVRAEQET